MKAIDLKNILRVVDSDADGLHDAIGIYLYGDSCDFVEGEFRS